MHPNMDLSIPEVMIENYEDKTDGEITKQTDNERFQYFGNMVLHQGGELGYHGYNHQPLCLGDTDYGDVLPYKTWKMKKTMESANVRTYAVW